MEPRFLELPATGRNKTFGSSISEK